MGCLLDASDGREPVAAALAVQREGDPEGVVLGVVIGGEAGEPVSAASVDPGVAAAAEVGLWTGDCYTWLEVVLDGRR